MLRQYHAQRFQPSLPLIPNKIRGKIVYCPQANDLGYRHRIGTIPIGTIVYVQDHISPMSGFRTQTVRRNPWILQAWENRPYHRATPHGVATTYLAGGHTAQIRSLRNGRVQSVADWILLACVDAGLTKSAPLRPTPNSPDAAYQRYPQQRPREFSPHNR